MQQLKYCLLLRLQNKHNVMKNKVRELYMPFAAAFACARLAIKVCNTTECVATKHESNYTNVANVAVALTKK